MWTYEKEDIDRDCSRFTLFREEEPLSTSEVIDGWIDNEDFRSFYSELLAQQDFDSFFWEHPPVTEDKLDRTYEFVLVKSSILEHINPNPGPFRKYFKEDQEVVVFPNLGGDARLIVPTPRAEHAVYPHLGPFVRKAPSEQIQALWRRIGREFKSSVGTTPKWLSTAGLGVYWLHIRIDTTPKYYRHKEYKSANP